MDTAPTKRTPGPARRHHGRRSTPTHPGSSPACGRPATSEHDQTRRDPSRGRELTSPFQDLTRTADPCTHRDRAGEDPAPRVARRVAVEADQLRSPARWLRNAPSTDTPQCQPLTPATTSSRHGVKGAPPTKAAPASMPGVTVTEGAQPRGTVGVSRHQDEVLPARDAEAQPRPSLRCAVNGDPSPGLDPKASGLGRILARRKPADDLSARPLNFPTSTAPAIRRGPGGWILHGLGNAPTFPARSSMGRSTPRCGGPGRHRGRLRDLSHGRDNFRTGRPSHCRPSSRYTHGGYIRGGGADDVATRSEPPDGARARGA